MDQTITRQRTINFPDTITNYQYESIVEYLNGLENILDYEITDEQLSIKYDLKRIAFDDIWSVIRSIMLQNQYPAFTWWKYNLIAQLEANEKDHLVNRFGWYEYIADIFVNHHAKNEVDTNNKKLWQQHAKKNKGT